MENTEKINIIKKIESYYRIKITDEETMILFKEIDDIPYEDVIENIIPTMLKRYSDFFTCAKFHNIVENYRELEKFKEHLGIKSFDELYEN